MFRQFLRSKAATAIGVLLAVVLGDLALQWAGFENHLVYSGFGLMMFGGLNILDDVIKYLIAHGFLDSAGGWKYSDVKAKTADYTVVTGTDASGTLFTNRGAAGTVIFTLPAPSQAIKGTFYTFAAVVAAQVVTVKTATVDTLITFNDLTADSVSLQTTSEIIGGVLRAVCDGTSWIVFGDSGAAHTYTVAT